MADPTDSGADESLRDTISAALSADTGSQGAAPAVADTAPAATSDPSPATPAPKADTTGGPARDPATGKFAPKPPDAAAPSGPSAATAPEAAASPPPAADPLAAPQHWKAEDRAIYDKIADPEAKRLALEMSKRMEAAHTRRTAELGDVAKIGAVFEPLRGEMQASGHTAESLTRFLVGELQGMRTNPAAKIKELAQAYNVDLAQLAGSPPSAPPGAGDAESHQPSPAALPPEVAGTIKTLESKLDAIERQSQQQRVSETRSAIDQFASETTGAGDKAHPYLDEVLADMMDLARLELSKGRQPALKELYDRAVWINPSTREKLQAATGAASQAAVERERQEKAAASTRAAVSVRGAPGATAAAMPERSLRETIAAQL